MHHVYFVFDESASMSVFTRAVREELHAMERHNGTSCDLQFIGFSDAVFHGTSVESVPQQRGSTCIWMAFEKISSLLRLIGEGDDASIVFISDGEDSNPEMCTRRFALMSRMACKCVLLCIGVGAQFPTTVVLEQLRPKFHTISDDSLPVVIPLCSLEDTSQVFAEMETIIFARPAFVTVFDEKTNIRDLMHGIEQTYNTVVNRCSGVVTKEASLAILDEGMAKLHQIKGLAERLRDTTLETETDFLPLASNLLRLSVFNTTKCLCKVKNILAQIGLMRSRISNQGVMLGSCTDAEKQKVLSYGHVVGRHLKAAHAYHGANYGGSKQTLKLFLEHYEVNPYDEMLEDKISLCSQAAFLQDAKESLKLMLPQIPTLVHLIQFMPLVCRTLTLSMPLPDGLQMNPWLGCVVGMPTILTHMTTYDFFERFNNRLERRGEVINGVMLVTNDPSGSLLAKGIGRHLASYLLTRNSDLYFPDADLATWGMTAAFLLRQPVLSEWMLTEMRSLVDMAKAVYSAPNGSWSSYVEEVMSDGFRRALLTSSVVLPKHCQCPHLNKFVLACMVAGDRLTLPQLQERRDAAIVELFARRGAKMTELFECRLQDQPLGPVMVQATLEETVEGFKRSMGKWKLVHTLHIDECRRLAHWNLSAGKLEQSFSNLAHLQGMKLAAVEDLSRLMFTGLKFKDDPIARCDGKKASMEDVNVDKELRKHVAAAIPGHVALVFQAAMDATHTLPIVMSEANMAAFLMKYGRDLKEELDVTPWGLSRVACLSLGCPLFGKPLGSSAKSRNGLPRMTDRLTQHLAGLPGEKGFHRDGNAAVEETKWELFESLFI